MNIPKAVLAGAALAFHCAMGAAAGTGPLTVTDPWVRATVPGQKVAAAYMSLTASSRVALVAAKSPAARKAELHSMTMEAGVMKMRQVARLDVMPGKPLVLAPGGYHLMLVDVARELKAGEKVSIVLTVEDDKGARRDINVDAPVREAAAQPHKH